MIQAVNISNHPKTGYERVVEVMWLRHLNDKSFMAYVVRSYNDGKEYPIKGNMITISDTSLSSLINSDGQTSALEQFITNMDASNLFNNL